MEGAPMLDTTTFIGLDVHARSIKAVSLDVMTGEVRAATFGYDAGAVAEWVRSVDPRARCVYESGVTGFDLQKRLSGLGVDCVVGAVSKMIKPSADRRRKNDRNDAEFLARMLSVGNVVEVWVPDDELFTPFRTLPHTAVMCGLIEQEKPQIALFGATPVGRDFAPRVSSALHSGLTADCTQLEIGDHKDAKTGKEYTNLLYQIRPAFGGNIIATIVNPDHRPQMATVREGVMRKECAAQPAAGEVKTIDWRKFVKDTDLAVKIVDRQIAESKIDIKKLQLSISQLEKGGYPHFMLKEIFEQPKTIVDLSLIHISEPTRPY